MTTIRRPRNRFPLGLKVSAALVLAVTISLAVAYYLVGQLSKTAANVASSDAALRVEAMERAATRYHELVNVTKRLHGEIADRLSRRPGLLDGTADLEAILRDPAHAGLRALAVLRPDGSVVAEASRQGSGPEWVQRVVDQPLVGPPEGSALRLTFEVSATLQQELQELKKAIDGTRTVAQIQTALPDSYQTTFLLLITIAGLLAAAIGILLSMQVTRRIDRLVATARRVTEGETEARVALRGKDEMAELAHAFNQMLDNLDQSRLQVEYLQRMGVWQDVARRLAHEIKNPLTPIQLAVQQCVSAYRGAATDPTRFAKLLQDTGEIVEEEITSLRRLVDTFRTLGALPRVEAAPIALAEVIHELELDPGFAAHLELVAPATPVTVRADKMLLKRVLANLVENGIHAGQEAGRAGTVTVRWSRDPAADAAVITVDDQGKGVAPDRGDAIFEPYVTTKPTGTGLGLAIARKIAIEHGGELSLSTARSPSGGARFVLTLPLRGPETSLG